MRRQEPDPSKIIRERLEQIFNLGVSLQDYIHELVRVAPSNERTKDVIAEMYRMEIRLSIVNDLLYQYKMDTKLDQAIERARNWKYSISAKNLID